MNIIVAVCRNNGIGKNNTLPWLLKQDLKYFKDKTIGNCNNVVVMGNNTYKSLNKPLPKRKNIIFTRKNDYHLSQLNMKNIVSKNDIDNPIYFNNINTFKKYIKKKEYDDVWIIGGEQIYNNFINIADNIYLTEIYEDFECDTFFPNIPDHFYLKHTSPIINENNIKYITSVYSNHKS
jgi:dihydrofolate reductase